MPMRDDVEARDNDLDDDIGMNVERLDRAARLLRGMMVKSSSMQNNDISVL